MDPDPETTSEPKPGKIDGKGGEARGLERRVAEAAHCVVDMSFPRSTFDLDLDLGVDPDLVQVSGPGPQPEKIEGKGGEG